MQRSRVTIPDIARELGLSVGTVSNALNDKGRVAAATRDRVLEAARLLGYSRNPDAVALRTGRHGIVSVHLPRNTSDLRFYMEFTFGLGEVLSEAGSDLLLAADRAGGAEARLVDGAVIVDWATDLVAPGELVAAGIPVLAVDGVPPGQPEPAAVVAVDYRTHAAEATRRAIASGARRPVLLEPGESLDSAWRQTLIDGYIDACEEAGLPARRFGFRVGLTADELVALLEGIAAEAEPDCIVFGGERLAGIAMTSLGWGAADSAVPWIVSCAGDPITELPSPHITALDLDAHGFGRYCGEVLLELIESRPTTTRFAEWPAEFAWAEHWTAPGAVAAS